MTINKNVNGTELTLAVGELLEVMNQQGEMVIRNVGETVMEVFEVTGFSDILTIE